MSVEEYPLIDGEYVSWANVDCSLEVYDGPSFQTRDYSKIDWSDKLEPGAVRGTGPKKRGRTVGEYDADATIEMYIDAARKFLKSLNQIKPGQAGLVVFDVNLQYAPLGTSPIDQLFGGDDGIITVQLVGCRIKNRSGSNANGTEGTTLSFPLDVMQVLVDGVALV